MTPSDRVLNLHRAWDKAVRDWSRDDLTDLTKTMLLGEAMYFASVELIAALSDNAAG